MDGIDGVISMILTENRKTVCPVALVGAEMFSRIQNPIYCLPSTILVLRSGGGGEEPHNSSLETPNDLMIYPYNPV